MHLYCCAEFEPSLPIFSFVFASPFACTDLVDSRCWDVHLKPMVDAVANRRQAKALEPQIMLTWAHRSSGEASKQATVRGGRIYY